MDKLFDISGRTALVTGGSRGIGEMISKGLLQAGVKVYITARKAEACNETAKRLSEFGTCISLPYDLSEVAQIDAIVADIKEREGKLDFLINNAGAAWEAPLDEFPESGWDKVMTINVKSLFFLTQRSLPLLRKAAEAGPPAKVINIASTDGIWVPDMETYSYVASKAGVIHLTKRLAKKLIKENIIVNCIAPGPFPSNINVIARDYPEMVGQSTPAGRVGNGTDIVGPLRMFLSRAGDYIVGETLTVDGGIVNARTHFPDGS